MRRHTMIFASKKENTYQYFVDLIDQNIHLFGEAVREKLELAEHEKLTDDEFVECYVDGMSRMVGQIYENAGETLRADAKCYARFCDAIEHPERYGFRFQNKNITIGKVEKEPRKQTVSNWSAMQCSSLEKSVWSAESYSKLHTHLKKIINRVWEGITKKNTR